jgi:hypothetical protein
MKFHLVMQPVSMCRPSEALDLGRHEEKQRCEPLRHERPLETTTQRPTQVQARHRLASRKERAIALARVVPNRDVPSLCALTDQ